MTKGLSVDTLLSNGCAVVLAAGKSKRFKTETSKLLAPVCGKPMILYPITRLAQLSLPTTVVLGHQAESIIASLPSHSLFQFVVQNEQLGTGHALALTKQHWQNDYVLVLKGDTPLVSKELLEDLINVHLSKKSDVTFCVTHPFDPRGYGRVIEEKGKVFIIEERDCTSEQRQTTLVNAGVYVFSRSFLNASIDLLTPSSQTGEYYLTQLIHIASEKGYQVHTVPVPFDQVRGVNTIEELWEVEQIRRSSIIKKLMGEGVFFTMPQTVHIEEECSVGPNSVVGPGVILKGKTTVGSYCILGAYSVLENCVIGERTQLLPFTYIENSLIASHARLGPYARIHQKSSIESSTEIGNFVEVKHSHLGSKTKAKHLSYIGDAHIGSGVNMGAGSITCNHDGLAKQKTTIHDHAYIGSNTILVAPVEVGSHSFTAAGSVITQEVPPHSLAIARARQTNKEGYLPKAVKQKKSLNEKVVPLPEEIKYKVEGSV